MVQRLILSAMLETFCTEFISCIRPLLTHLPALTKNAPTYRLMALLKVVSWASVSLLNHRSKYGGGLIKLNASERVPGHYFFPHCAWRPHHHYGHTPHITAHYDTRFLPLFTVQTQVTWVCRIRCVAHWALGNRILSAWHHLRVEDIKLV